MSHRISRVAALILGLLPLSAGAETHRIEITSGAFVPAVLTIAAGDTLRVMNRDGVPHTFTAEDGTYDSGRLMDGDITQLVLATMGTHVFRCALGGQQVHVLVEPNLGAVRRGRVEVGQAVFHRGGR